MGVCSEPSGNAPRSGEGKEEESSPETKGPCRSEGTSPPTIVDVQGGDAGNQLAESPTWQDDNMQEPLEYQTGNDDEEQPPTGHGTAENQADGELQFKGLQPPTNASVSERTDYSVPV
ncbi:hypothetical protein JHK85_023046 [Glycine max]|nr:hypothetical protein JHK85_023046 [Glycine max]